MASKKLLKIFECDSATVWCSDCCRCCCWADRLGEHYQSPLHACVLRYHYLFDCKTLIISLHPAPPTPFYSPWHFWYFLSRVWTVSTYFFMLYFSSSASTIKYLNHEAIHQHSSRTLPDPASHHNLFTRRQFLWEFSIRAGQDCWSHRFLLHFFQSPYW